MDRLQQNYLATLGTSSDFQDLRWPNDENGIAMMDLSSWPMAFPASSGSCNMGIGPYAIQKYSTEHSDDPFVATGVLPPTQDVPSSSQKAHFIVNTPYDPIGLSPHENGQRPADLPTHHDDSGYGGSVVSPSVRTGQSRSEDMLICPHCGRNSKNKSEFRKHINRHDKPHKCEHGNCNKGFATQNDLDRHRKTVHRDEFQDRGNSVTYKCLHCENQPGKANRRKKTEWPRKDNFLAHLARVHGLEYGPSDNLDDYILRAQSPTTPLSDRPAYMREEARKNDLKGVGTIPGFTGHPPGVEYEKEIPQLLEPQTDELAHQRFQMVLHRNSRVLASTNVFDTETEAQFISPQMLGPVTSGGMIDLSLQTAQNAFVHSTPVDSHGVISPASKFPGHHQNHQFSGIPTTPTSAPTSAPNAPAPAPIRHDLALDMTDTEMYSPIVQPPYPIMPAEAGFAGQPSDSLPFPLYPQIGQSPSACSLQTSQLSADAQMSPGALPEEVMSLLKRLPEETLRAALEQRAHDDDDGSVSGTDTTSNSLTYCPTCSKHFKRPCEVKKHMKRHSRPYGCTWAGCHKTFGSKNDWKRHENKQHYSVEVWKCDFAGCGAERNRREAFTAHLEETHNLSDSKVIDTKAERCRTGKHCNPEAFWCGFCNEYIRVTGAADAKDNSWSKRFDHIDDHFCGRGGQSQKGIEEWRHEPQRCQESSSHGASPASSRGASRHAGAVSSVTVGKRKADLMDSEQSAKRMPKRQRTVKMWYCCHCPTFNNWQTSELCVNCQRYRCDGCLVSLEVVPDEDMPGSQICELPGVL